MKVQFCTPKHQGTVRPLKRQIEPVNTLDQMARKEEVGDTFLDSILMTTVSADKLSL